MLEHELKLLARTAVRRSGYGAWGERPAIPGIRRLVADSAEPLGEKIRLLARYGGADAIEDLPHLQPGDEHLELLIEALVGIGGSAALKRLARLAVSVGEDLFRDVAIGILSLVLVCDEELAYGAPPRFIRPPDTWYDDQIESARVTLESLPAVRRTILRDVLTLMCRQ